MRRFPAVLSIVALAAAGGAAPLPVADGFPAWSGLGEKNYVYGRELSPSDLRHKVTVVFEIEPTDEKSAKEQILAAADVAKLDSLTSLGHSVAWERLEMPRGITVVVSDCGGKDSTDLILGVLKNTKDEGLKKDLTYFKSAKIAVYKDVTFPGAPQAPEGKRPFVYVMGPSGTEPLYSGAYDKKALAAATAAAKKAKAALPKWRPFYGPIEEVEHCKSFDSAFDPKKPKPLAVEIANLKKVLQKPKSPEAAAEAQILFDAVEQTKNDLVLRISLEAHSCPHRAAYDMFELTKHFPGEKRRLAKYTAALKAVPEATTLGKMFGDIMKWSDPAFECKNEAEAKKIVESLKKIKKAMEKMKNSKDIRVQNGAMVIEAEVDELIDVIPSKVMVK